jgi:uncharacterized damage-inducible protein DinB
MNLIKSGNLYNLEEPNQQNSPNQPHKQQKMTKEYFTDLAKYNRWANEKIISWCQAIDDEQWNQEIVSSFPRIAATVLHIVGAEQIWAERLQNVKNPDWLPSTFIGDKDDTIAAWRKSSDLLIQFTEIMHPERLLENQYYKRINGEEFTQPVYEILSHVFNHSTYHRGQIVTMLRQVGFEDVSSTDLLNYYRK